MGEVQGSGFTASWTRRKNSRGMITILSVAGPRGTWGGCPKTDCSLEKKKTESGAGLAFFLLQEKKKERNLRTSSKSCNTGDRPWVDAAKMGQREKKKR